MTTSRVAVLILASIVGACSSEQGPSEDVVRAAAKAARQATLEEPAHIVSSHIASTHPTKPCSVTIANGESHSSLAQMVLQEASLAVEATAELSISESNQSDLQLHLFRTERVDPRDRVWERSAWPDHAPGDFYVAYAILGKDHRFLAGDLVKCSGEYKACGQSMATRTLRICQSREA